MPLFVSDLIVPAFDTPAPPAPLLTNRPPVPPLIVPLAWLMSEPMVAPCAFHTPAPPAPPAAAAAGSTADLAPVRQRLDRPGVRHPRAADAAYGGAGQEVPPRQMPWPRFPPLIAPLLDRVVMAPEFATPAPPEPTWLVESPPFPPLILPLLDRVVIVAEFHTPAPPAPPTAPPELNPMAEPPLPPLIAPLLDRVVIVAEFDTPAPPAPPERSEAAAAVSAADRAAVGQGRDRPGVRYARAARAAAAEGAARRFRRRSRRCWSAS